MDRTKEEIIKTTKIKVMVNTRAASCPLGVKIKDYYAGQTYNIFDELANVFISQGWGVQEKSIDDIENKAIKKSPENKMFSLTKRKQKRRPKKQNKGEN